MIRLRGFMGMIPKLHPTALPEGYAQVCRNARMRSGALVPFRQPVQADFLPAAKEVITKIAGYWRGYDGRVSAVQGPVAEERAYVSGDGAPRVESYLAGNIYSYGLALATPTVATVAAVQSGTAGPNNNDSIVFSYTWRTSLGEESKPAPLSVALAFTPGMAIRVTTPTTAPASRGITHKRIYRSETAYDGTTALHFVAETTLATAFWDYTALAPLQEPIASTNYDTPVVGLKGFTAMPNGIIAGFAGRRLYFCEPYRPHAWPEKYSLVVDYDIVGLAAFGSTLAILTKGTPYIAQGSHPSTVAMTKIEEMLPCMSDRGIVDLGYAAAYPSSDGLVTISASGARLVSQALFSRDDWQALKPATFIAGMYEGRYVFLHRPVAGQDRRIGMIDLTGESPFYITIEGTGRDFYYDIPTGELFLLASNGTSIQRFDDPAGTAMTYLWRSKKMLAPGYVNYPWAILHTDTTSPQPTPVARLYGQGGDGAAGATQIASITGTDAPQRLPSGRLDQFFEVEIEGTRPVFGFAAAFDAMQLYG